MTFANADELEVFRGKKFNEIQRAQADLLLELATGAIIAEAGQSIERSETTAKLTGTWDRDLELPERPVVGVSLVVVNGVTLTTNDWFWVGGQKLRRGQPFGPNASGDWYGNDDDTPGRIDGDPIAGASGAIPYTWGGPEAIVTVTYAHGRDPVPNLARLVCLSAADRYLSVPTGVVQATLGPASFTFDTAHGDLALSDQERRLIRRAFRKRARIA